MFLSLRERGMTASETRDWNAMTSFAFLALAIWREARGASMQAKIAVAYSILNRVERPSWWGNDVLSVLFKKWQYSSLTDPKDRQLTTWPSTSDPSWYDCLSVAGAGDQWTVQDRLRRGSPRVASSRLAGCASRATGTGPLGGDSEAPLQGRCL